METEENKQDFADFIRFMRKSVNMKQQEFADKVGFKAEAISKYERGVRFPRTRIRVELEQKVREVVKAEIIRRRKEGLLQ